MLELKADARCRAPDAPVLEFVIHTQANVQEHSVVHGSLECDFPIREAVLEDAQRGSVTLRLERVGLRRERTPHPREELPRRHRCLNADRHPTRLIDHRPAKPHIEIDPLRENAAIRRRISGSRRARRVDDKKRYGTAIAVRVGAGAGQGREYADYSTRDTRRPPTDGAEPTKTRRLRRKTSPCYGIGRRRWPRHGIGEARVLPRQRCTRGGGTQSSPASFSAPRTKSTRLGSQTKDRWLPPNQ